FSTPEWAATWWRHFGRGGALHLGAWRASDGRLHAIVPLYTTRLGPLRLARLVGSTLASRLHPICAPGDRAEAARGLQAALEAVRADLFVADALPAEENWAEYVPGGLRVRIPSPVIPL